MANETNAPRSHSASALNAVQEGSKLKCSKILGLLCFPMLAPPSCPRLESILASLGSPMPLGYPLRDPTHPLL